MLPRLFAFTSMCRFCMTYQPAYVHGFGFSTIVLAFDSRSQLFEVYYNGLDKLDRTTFRCEEFEVVRLVDALVLRMLTRSEQLPERARVYVVVPGVEEAPWFHIASPRLARPEPAVDFVKEVTEEPRDEAP